MARNNSIDSYIDVVGEYFKRLPELPKGGRDAIVTITPWLALIFGVLGVIVALGGLGLFPVGLLGGAYSVGGALPYVILGFVSSALLLMAYPGTKALKARGWRLLYYSEVVGLVSSIIALSLGGVFFTLIGFYFLYQIRSYYR